MNRAAAAAWIATACACSRPSPAPAQEGGPTSSAVEAGPPAVASAPPGNAPSPVTLWRGTYVSAPGALYIPADWKTVHWKVDDDGAGLGQGELVFSVDSAGGRLHGTLGGPLGPARVDGLVAGGRLTATFSRDDPHDQGFTGTLQGSIADRVCEGTISASPGQAGAIRAAKFSVTASGAPDAGS